MNNPIADFATFNDVEFAPLRAYNRLVVAHNIKEDLGNTFSAKYVGQFPIEERNLMLAMINVIKKHGVEKVKSQIMKMMPISEEVQVA